jgi:hypothetical protein
MRIRLTLLAILLPLLALVPTGCDKPDAPASVTGRVQWQGRGIPMAWVEVYTKPEQDRSTPPVAETATDEEGRFEVTVEPGRYWVWAKATLDENGRERRLVGQAVPNPIEPKPGESAAVLITLDYPSGFASSAGPTGMGVTGRVTADDNPEKTINLYVYKGALERPVGPGFVATVPPAADGTFHINLAPGSYTLSARHRASGLDYGPPGPEDRVAIISFEVTDGSYLDLGAVTLETVDPEKWRETTATLGESATTISGTVLNADETPAKGLRVLAFIDSRMAGKPAAISPATGEDGHFILHLPGEGRYFLGARSKVGGPASPGEKIGSHRGPDGDGFAVGAKERIDKVEITVEEIW